MRGGAAALAAVFLFAGGAAAQSQPDLAVDDLRRDFSERECVERIEAAARGLQLRFRRSRNGVLRARGEGETVMLSCERRGKGSLIRIVVATSERGAEARKDELARLIDQAPDQGPAAQGAIPPAVIPPGATATAPTPPGAASTMPGRAPARPAARTDDIVWQHKNGQVHYWPMRDGQRRNGIDIYNPIGGDWSLKGVGDLDGDGTDDIVWQHSSGQVHYWPMNGGRRVNGVNIHSPVGPESTFVGVGDIDGDGTDDIVWQHSSRQVHYWSMRGGQRQGGIDLHIPMNRDWRFAGVGDLDGDGTDDILWQHPGGQMLYWRLRGGKVAAGVEIADRPDRGWSLKGVGDVDGDGTDDLVWQHGSGQVHYWKMQGGRRVAGIDVFSPVAAEWNLVGVGDVDAGAAPASAAPAASMPTDMVGLLVAQPWEWIDNGRSLGTITFDRDGSARDTWLNLPQTWRVDANGDLVVAVMFGQWVTRLAYDPQSGSFAGARDRSSRTQDGVRTELRPTRATGR